MPCTGGFLSFIFNGAFILRAGDKSQVLINEFTVLSFFNELITEMGVRDGYKTHGLLTDVFCRGDKRRHI